MRGPPIAAPDFGGGLLERPSANLLVRKPSGTLSWLTRLSVGGRRAGLNSPPTRPSLSNSRALSCWAAAGPRQRAPAQAADSSTPVSGRVMACPEKVVVVPLGL